MPIKVGRHPIVLVALVLAAVFALPCATYATNQPVVIFHAFDQHYHDIEKFVCEVSEQGYSHIQIAPAQKSNPDPKWWARYQPVDYSVIEGRGSEQELRNLILKAHGCNVKVIADVVFNHMADMEQYRDLSFPQFTSQDFHSRCGINYEDGERGSEINCWLGSLPDLDSSKPNVQNIHKAYIKKLLDLGIDGFRLDAAKHMQAEVVQTYIDYINYASHGNAWSYLEVITDHDTQAGDYNYIAAVTDFVLYDSMKQAFSYGGDLRWLRVPRAIGDPRSVTFGRNHDTIEELNPGHAIKPYSDPSDSYLATAYVLARESGTPLVLNWDNADIPYIKHGVKFRRMMQQRKEEGKNVKENVLAAVDSPTVLLMERGSEGFFVVNKGVDVYDVRVLDMTLTNIDGCYRELRSNFTVAVERRSNGKKYVTRWGTWARGGMEIHGRDALYFVRDSWSQCLPM
ncbi:MAG: alpha-amylase family glycosyl hydrolase [Desulforhabdus sp.]|nr:alpha-amylase family glycosyl hydrolase [Desulforhabdus sp.]